MFQLKSNILSIVKIFCETISDTFRALEPSSLCLCSEFQEVVSDPKNYEHNILNLI